VQLVVASSRPPAHPGLVAVHGRLASGVRRLRPGVRCQEAIQEEGRASPAGAAAVLDELIGDVRGRATVDGCPSTQTLTHRKVQELRRGALPHGQVQGRGAQHHGRQTGHHASQHRGQQRLWRKNGSMHVLLHFAKLSVQLCLCAGWSLGASQINYPFFNYTLDRIYRINRTTQKFCAKKTPSSSRGADTGATERTLVRRGGRRRGHRIPPE
jgi:hypothetical protein